MDQGMDQVQEELNILSAPVTEKCQLSDNSASSSSDLRNEGNKNSKVSDISVEGSVTELQLQNIPLPSFAPQLGIGNVEDTKAANISAETHIRSLKEGQKDDFKLSGSHLLYNRNSTEIDEKSKKTGSSCPLEMQNIPLPSFSPQLGIGNLEDNKAANISAETHIRSLKEGQKDDFKLSGSHLLYKRKSTEIEEKSKKPGSSCPLEMQNIPLPSFSPQLGIGNLEVTKTANISAETHIKSLKDSRKVDFKLSDSHVLHKRNSTKIDEKSKKTGSSYRLKNVAFIDLTVTVSLPTSENVNFIDLTVNSDEEQQSDRHKASSALNTRKVSGKHVAKSRHVPYSAKLSRHTHLRTVSCVNQKSMDHVSARIDSRAVLIKNEKFGTTDTDKLSKGEDAELNLKPSSDLVRKSSVKKLEIKTDILVKGKGTCQSNEPMNMSVHIEGDLDCPMVNDDSRSTSPVTETSLCFENMSLHVSEEDANLITEDVSSETAAAVASIKLPGDCEQSCSVSVNSLRNVQQQSGSAVNATSSAQSKNGSASNLSKNAQRTSSVETNTVANMQQNSSAVHASKGIQQQKNNDITTSTSNKIQRQTSNSADTSKNMPLSISIDSMKNIQISSATSSSKNFQQTSKSTNASKDLQKENCIDVIPSSVKQRINAKDASQNKGQKVTTTAAIKKVEQKSSNAVVASKNKEQKVGNATTAAKSIQQQSSSTACLDNVQPPKCIGSDIPKVTQQENACIKLSQTVQKQSGPVFKHPDVLKPSAQGENINSCAQVPSGKIDLSKNKISLKKTESKKSTPSLLSVTNIQYQPLQDCQDLLQLASCKTTDYRVQKGKPKHILEESSRANTFERFKDFRFSRATENDMLELYGRLPMSLPEDLEETPMCKEDITDFSSKKNKVQDLEKVLHNQRL